MHRLCGCCSRQSPHAQVMLLPCPRICLWPALNPASPCMQGGLMTSYSQLPASLGCEGVLPSMVDPQSLPMLMSMQQMEAANYWATHLGQAQLFLTRPGQQQLPALAPAH